MPATRAPGSSYENAGRNAALAVRGYSSVIVASDDVVAAGHAAVGIALTECAHRLVMIADLGNETSSVRALVRDDDPHGIYDAFEFGTSFVRIAREVEDAENLYVMPSGTETAATEKVISSPRWKTFAAEFAKSDELLLLVVSADAPALDQLAHVVDGAVLVGTQRLETAPDTRILARIPHPDFTAPPPPAPIIETGGWSTRNLALAAGVLMAIGIAGGALLGGSGSPATPVAAPSPSDSTPTLTVRPSSQFGIPVNPADSATATPFSVEIVNANTLEGANLLLQTNATVMPAATISLVPIGDTESTWYKVLAGAYEDSADADRLLATLRRRRVIQPENGGAVIRAPLAMLIDSIPNQAGMLSRTREKIRELAARDVVAYALIQRDGSARIYAGAFEFPDQASLAATALRVAGLSPVLAYRTGRLQ
ncbi:MAG: SPOR domain-containing protein [Gemmatimonadaceae bacterium]